MGCEILSCCSFLERMKELPKTTKYVIEKLCQGDYARCTRFQLFTQVGTEQEIPLDLHPDDTEELERVRECLRRKRDQAQQSCSHPGRDN